jgi:cytoskeletal protein CcmA (bactofilin family)
LLPKPFAFLHLNVKNSMFGNKENTTTPTSQTPANTGSGGLNTIVRDTEITGNVVTGSDLRIEGKLKGDIDCKGKLIIGSTGDVQGDVICANAMIEGKYTGNLVVKGTLTLRDSAVLNGKVKVGKLVMQSGAVFNANCNMQQL